MAPADIASALLTAAALVYASSSLLLGHLLDVGEEMLPEQLMHEHRKIAYLSVAASFFFVSASIALLATSITSGPKGPDVLGISDKYFVWLGSLSLVAAVAFPSYSAMWLSLDIYGEYSDFRWPR